MSGDGDGVRTTSLIVAGVTLCCLACMIGACEWLGFIAQTFPTKTKALYRLEDRPTVVLVEDPNNAFRNPDMVRRIAREMNAAFRKEKLIDDLIPAHKIETLMVTLGDDYARAGVDQIGRAVGAEQVVYIHVESVTLYPQPGLLRPTAVVEVKVVDAVEGRRLFPAVNSVVDDELIARRGHRVIIQLPPRVGGQDNLAARRAAAHQLVSRMARDAARLFHDYRPRQPGEPFE